MTFETIKNNIDKKVERILTTGSVDDAIININSTCNAFKNIINQGVSGDRKHMIDMYIEYSGEKLKDLETLNKYIETQI